MLLARLVETSQQVAATSKRLAKIELLAALLRQLRAEEVAIAVLYLSGSTPQGKLGAGYRTLQEAATAPAGEASLQLLDVDRALQRLSGVQGKGSERQRGELLRALFGPATAPEQSFLRGLLTGELRQGALEGIMLEAVAKASGVAVEPVRRAAMVAGDLAAVAQAALASGEAGLAQYGVRLFCPVQPMLAQSAEDVAEALEELGEAALEFKMDGARVQAHKSGDEVALYTRSLNDVTAAAPEVVEAVRALPVRDAILDGEAIALQAAGRPYPFQVTMRRFGRKLEVERMRAELPLSAFWFDLIYLNGGALLDEAQSRRFENLREISPAGSLIPYATAGRVEAAEEFLRSALERGHEGIMAKATGAPYAAGARGQNWLKVKQARTLDLVILAAEWGSGRRHGWLSNLHLGAPDGKGGFAMLGKTFKGLTDEMLAWQTQELLKIEVARDNYTVYVEPTLVAEIAFNEIQVSPRYASGLSLRFARVKRYRTDKTAGQADTLETVQRLAGM